MNALWIIKSMIQKYKPANTRLILHNIMWINERALVDGRKKQNAEAARCVVGVSVHSVPAHRLSGA